MSKGEEDKKTIIRKLAQGLRSLPRNLVMPGNPRYKPERMIEFWGYDNLTKPQIDVQLALVKVLVKLGVAPAKIGGYLTEDLRKKLHSEITTSLQDAIEKAVTNHDIVALIEAIREALERILGKEAADLIAGWIHYLATSYDIIDTARIITYKMAFRKVTLPSALKLIDSLSKRTIEFSGELQAGRSHGQIGEPITAGFWLATILERMVNITEHMIARESELCGKFSGAMGACNSQVALGVEEKAQRMFKKSFEQLVLEELNLEPGPISTQILLPEALSRFLFEYTLFSGALGQIGTDIRQLARSGIEEVAESFGNLAAGSSAMSHKRNPIKSEGVVCLFTMVKNRFHELLDILISEHNRDATNMCVMRDLPGIVILVQQQLDVMNEVIPNLYVDKEALKRNFDTKRHLILSEEVHLAMIGAGYRDDAHYFVNHVLVPISAGSGKYLIDELLVLGEKDDKLAAVVNNIPRETIELLRTPEKVTGKSEEKALEIAKRAEDLIEKYSYALKREN